MISPNAVQRVQLRAVERQDCRLLWELANEPTARASAFSCEYISWENHVNWFDRKLSDPGCSMFIVTDADGREVGQVRFDRCDATTLEIDVTIAHEHRRRGVGAAAIESASRAVLRAVIDVSVIMARIKLNNAASIRAFEKARFVRTGEEIVGGQQTVRMVLRRGVIDVSAE